MLILMFHMLRPSVDMHAQISEYDCGIMLVSSEICSASWAKVGYPSIFTIGICL